MSKHKKLVQFSLANEKLIWDLGKTTVQTLRLEHHKYLLHSQLGKSLARPHEWRALAMWFYFPFSSLPHNIASRTIHRITEYPNRKGPTSIESWLHAGPPNSQTLHLRVLSKCSLNASSMTTALGSLPQYPITLCQEPFPTPNLTLPWHSSMPFPRVLSVSPESRDHCCPSAPRHSPATRPKNRVAPWPLHFQQRGLPSQILPQLGISPSSKAEGWSWWGIIRGSDRGSIPPPPSALYQAFACLCVLQNVNSALHPTVVLWTELKITPLSSSDSAAAQLY